MYTVKAMKIKATEPARDLKEPLKSTDFVAIERVRDQQKTVGLKTINENQQMPRVDQEGSLQKVMEQAAKQDHDLTLDDWEWLKNAYKQAVLLDELNRRVMRQERLKEMKLTDLESARTLSEISIEKRQTATFVAAKEIQKIQREQMLRADRDWRDWINMIDRKSIKNKQELLESFMKALGYKVGFIRQAWNQKHLTELKKSLSKQSLEQQSEAQRLHFEQQRELAHIKQDLAFTEQATALRALNEAVITQIFEGRETKNQRRLEQSRPQESGALERMRIEIEQKDQSNLKDFRSKLAELQSAALSAEGRQKALQKSTALEAEKEIASDLVNKSRAAKYLHEKARSLLAAAEYKLNFIPLPWKRAELEQEKSEITMIATEKSRSQNTEMTTLLEASEAKSTFKQQQLTQTSEAATTQAKHRKGDEPRSGLASEELPPLKPKTFKPNFSAISPKPLDVRDQEDQLAQLQTEKDRKQSEVAQELQLKIAQLQMAAQLAQTDAINSVPKHTERNEQQLQIDVRQKIKAAK